MDDKARMIAAARRTARRIAKKTELTYQQALDEVARDLGRDHWAHYASDPLPVPRQPIDPQDVGFVRGTASRTAAIHGAGCDPAMDASAPDDVVIDVEASASLFRIDWNMVEQRRRDEFGGLRFVPSFNALADRYVGRQVSDVDREAHLAKIALILIPPGRDGDGYFVQKGRSILEGFLMEEVVRSWDEGRTATVPMMLDWITRGLYASYEPGVQASRDRMADFLRSMVEGRTSSDSASTYVRIRITPLVSMHDKERSGILGTMDQGLLPFKNRHVMDLNS